MLKWRDQSGAALIMVMLVSMLLLGMGLALNVNSMFETEITANHEREMLAFYAAQTGIERAIDGFRTDYTINSLPADGAVIFNQVRVSYQGSTVTSDYTVTLSRRDSPASSGISPYPIFYTITSVGRLTPANSSARDSMVTLTQSVSVSPRSLANWTLFYDVFDGAIAFQSTFRLAGRLAVNDLRGVQTFPDTTINGDFYAAGPITKCCGFGVPRVSGNLVENGGRIDFPATITPFASGATSDYKFNGTTRMIFSSNATVTVYNAEISGGVRTMPMPNNGIMLVSGGDCIVEGTVKGRVTVCSTDDIMINGGIRYADQSPVSWDTLALVAQKDIILPQYYYTATSSLTDVEANWIWGGVLADGIRGGTWGEELPGDFHIDATLVALTGSSPAVINPLGRRKGELYVYGNSIGKIASVTINWSLDHGLNENYTENKKLDMVPPPGFPMDPKLLCTFFSFREVRSPLS